MANSVGIGDSDDFAILVAALIESIGGVTRIILANNSWGDHAYTEVYLGQLDDPNCQVGEIIKWLQNEYDVDNIYGHINIDKKEVWLNFDWGQGPGGPFVHPGGPLFPGDRHDILYIRDQYRFTPLRMPEAANRPPRLLSLIPDKNSPQDAGSVVIWRVKASDPDNDRILYRFFLDGFPMSKWKTNNSWIWNTTEADIGDNQIEVIVIDGRHAGPNGFDDNRVLDFSIIESGASSKQQMGTVMETVEANATISSISPVVGEAVTFNASRSKDTNDRMIEYEWDFGDGYSARGMSIDHQYLKKGTYNVKLAVTDDRGVKNISFINVHVMPETLEIHANVKPFNGSIYTPFTYSVSAESPQKDDFDIELLIKAPGSSIWISQGMQTYRADYKELLWPNLSFSTSPDILGMGEYKFVVDNEYYRNYIGPEIDVAVRNESYKRRADDNFDYSAEVKSSRPYVDMELLYTDDGLNWYRSGQIRRYIFDDSSSMQFPWITLTWQDQPWHKTIRVDERRIG